MLTITCFLCFEQYDVFVGVDNGLRLLLNLEQYEYMRSSREVGGAYAMVHDQSDEARLVKGKGFTICKEMHTIVKLDKIEVKLPTFSQTNENQACFLLKRLV